MKRFLFLTLYLVAESVAFFVKGPVRAPLVLDVVDSVGLHHRDPDVEAERDDVSHESFESIAVDSDCEEYAYLVQNLANLARQTQGKIAEMKQLTQRIHTLEDNHPGVTKLGKIPAHVKLALIEAKAVNDVYGPRSAQAETAWQCVTEAHRNGLGADMSQTEVQIETQFATELSEHSLLVGHEHDVNTVLDADSLEEILESLARIEQLARLVEIENDRVEEIMDLY